MKNPEKEADERLLVEAAQRDPRRFTELYERNVDRVYAYIVRRVRSREQAQDLTSEVFQKALANIGRFEWRGTPVIAWLLRIAANEISDHQRSSAREGEELPADAIDESSMEEIERRAMLFQLVETLPADQRRVIEARFVEQKSIREIAKELQRSEGAVKQLQWRALENLRARVEGADG